MYQVLARKYRPQNFDEVAGQAAVVQTLKNVIESGRVHHAYLFSGARGIGKTSLARIFAKSINCEKGPTLYPCQQCTLCKEITLGNSLDVQEIDGASNTSVDDVRELREQLKYQPNLARYKIYIIDEVHMLSTSAFNALLKTLEEPPPHVVFLFATTESHKIPATILSRCQRFELKRLSFDELFSILEKICRKEGVQPVEDALRLIVREAQGSVRDAQSLLDQAISYTQSLLEPEKVRAMLGLSDQVLVGAITQKVLQGLPAEALKLGSEVYGQGHDLKQFLIQWLGHWRNLLVYQASLSETVLPDLTRLEKEAIQEQAKTTSLEALDVGFHLLYRGIEEIGRSEFPKLLFDALIVKLAHLNELQSLQEILQILQSSPREEKVSVEKDPKEGRESFDSMSLPSSKGSDVAGFLKQLAQARPLLSSPLDQVQSAFLEGDQLILRMKSEGMSIDLLRERKGQIQEFAQSFFHRPLQLKIEVAAPLAHSTKEKGMGPEPRPRQELESILQNAAEILNAKIIR